jgi:hypothetical protein
MSYLNPQTKFIGKLGFLVGGVVTVLILSGWINVLPEDWTESEANEIMSTGFAAARSTGVAIPALQEVDVIRNGDFEGPFDLRGVAEEWAPFTNGQAFVGWYDEQWPEAVQTGDHAQLLEIDEVEGDALDSVIAIFQTVDVAPNAEYGLTINAIMRTNAPIESRNNFEYIMNWGIDPTGQGDYDNVQEWVFMPLTEQLRIGSNGEFPDDVPLFYEAITGTVTTSGTNRITLFIRGVKKFALGNEVNFNVDNVSLIGPVPGAMPEPEPQAVDPSEPTLPAPAETDSNLPETGARLLTSNSVGIFALGGLVLVVIGTAAAASLLGLHRRE